MRLPFQAVDRVARGLPLRDQRRAQPAAGALVVALRARQVELADALPEEGFAARAEGLQPGVARRRDRQAARLQADQRFQRQQVRVLAARAAGPGGARGTG
jgi:hypothetical protein